MFPVFPTYIQDPERERCVSNLFDLGSKRTTRLLTLLKDAPQGKAGVKKIFISKNLLIYKSNINKNIFII
jgi:hypothetical protein